MTGPRTLPPETPREEIHLPPGYVPVQQQVLDLLREKSGAIVDAFNVAEKVAALLEIPEQRARSALLTLESRGFIEYSNLRTATLTELGWSTDVTADTLDRTKPSPPPPSTVAALSSALSSGHPADADRPAGPVLVKHVPPESLQNHVESEPSDDTSPRHAETQPTARPPFAPAAPVQQATSTKKEKQMGKATIKKSTAAAILTFLRSEGGSVKRDDGMCSGVVRDGAGLSGSISDDLRELDALGLIRRTVKGKRTFAIELTARGIQAAIAAAAETKEAAGGQVSELSRGDRVGKNRSRTARPPRRKTGATTRPKAAVRGRRKARAKVRAQAGGRRRADGDGACVDEPLRDLSVPRVAQEGRRVILIDLTGIQADHRDEFAAAVDALIGIFKAEA